MLQGVILAAGQARRFGRDKRLALVNGQPMAIVSALRMRDAVGNVLVVTGNVDDALVPSLQAHGIAYTVCHDAHLGMGHSLAHAVRETGNASGWLIGLADMPYIHSATIRAVADRVGPRNIVIPVIQGQRGHPVGFGQFFREHLLNLRGDTGAKLIVRAHAAQICELGVPDPGILLDVDQPSDLQPSAGATPGL